MNRLSMHETQHLLVTEPAWLLATGGHLWVTRRGEWDDHVLGAGERMPVRPGDDLLLQAWNRDIPAGWEWHPAPESAWRQGLRRRLLGNALAAVERALRLGADGLAALARKAAAMARRAQGCMPASESMASASTVR